MTTILNGCKSADQQCQRKTSSTCNVLLFVELHQRSKHVVNIHRPTSLDVVWCHVF